MKERHGPYHRTGEPGGPGCAVGVLPVFYKDQDGNQVEACLLDGGEESTEIELLRTIASRMGIRWGNDELGWWAVVRKGFPTWSVWRQDDNGNRFLVESNLSESEARAKAQHYEDTGHKQTYWAEDQSQS